MAVSLGVAAALAAPASQALFGWGLTASDFSSQGDSTLRVAGYAFSIWGVIYAGLVAYAVRAWTGGRQASADAAVAAASLGCGAWIVAAGLNLRWLTVLVILASLIVAVVGLVRLRRAAPNLSVVDRLTVLWPLSLLAGWLTAASMVNVLTVLTAEGWIGPALAVPAALAGVLIAGAATLGVLVFTRCASYGLPVAWGLIGAFMAERGGQPVVAYAAMGCAAILLAASVILARVR